MLRLKPEPRPTPFGGAQIPERFILFAVSKKRSGHGISETGILLLWWMGESQDQRFQPQRADCVR
jgi:hypothetical protein